MNKFKVLIPLAIPRQPFDRLLPDCNIIYPSDDKFTSDEVSLLIKDCNFPQLAEIVKRFSRCSILL